MTVQGKMIRIHYCQNVLLGQCWVGSGSAFITCLSTFKLCIDPWLFCPSNNLEHRLALPTRSCASVRALLYRLCDPRRCEINRKVSAPRRVSASGAPYIVTWIKQTWIKHQCTGLKIQTNHKNRNKKSPAWPRILILVRSRSNTNWTEK